MVSNREGGRSWVALSGHWQAMHLWGLWCRNERGKMMFSNDDYVWCVTRRRILKWICNEVYLFLKTTTKGQLAINYIQTKTKSTLDNKWDKDDKKNYKKQELKLKQSHQDVLNQPLCQEIFFSAPLMTIQQRFSRSQPGLERLCPACPVSSLP